MIVRCVVPADWCRTWRQITWRQIDAGYYWAPDADRPRGDVFATDPIDLDALSYTAANLWRQHQERRYGATPSG